MNNSPLSSPQEREAALFALALEKPSAERASFLQAVCGKDNALRQRLDALLAAHEHPDQLLEDATSEPTVKATTKLEFAEEPADETVGQTLGRYKLLERVGEGGCGVVYVAEQTQPVRRRVALKVIKLGMDTREVIARFEAERQALAMMDHPNIAKVLDAGTTDVGRPYFVMELVRGIRITDYCDQANLSTKERLDLFIKVCQAIQHAHQKGIIHRDIKPSNILVTLHDGVPVPKVIDFGIAKATEGRLTDATVYTQLHQFMGTPAYMSPEQAEMSGLDIDTRSDIYSLGVLLYELLAGSTPFNGKELLASGIDAMRKTIREKEPVRPSTRLATLKGEELTTTAKRRAADAPKLIHLLKGDLDWIVMKCLEKDRTRRYETANGLAADLKRHLGNEPVTARPPSTAYKLQKAFRRNKLAFTATTAVAAALLVGISLSLWQAVRATQAERQQSTLRERAEEARKEADEQRAAAQAAEKLTAQQAIKLREELYAAKIERASAQISRGEMLEARNELNACDPHLRGWEWHHLDSLNPLVATVPGVDRPCFTPDGRHLIVCGARQDNRNLNLRDLSSGEVVAIFSAQNSVHSPAITPDGRRVAFGDSRGNVFMWDLPSRKQIWSVPAHAKRLDGMVFSRDGTLLASTGTDGSLKLLRASDGQVLREWQVPGASLRCPALSPDGQRITVARNEDFNPGAIHSVDTTVWDTATGEEVFSLKGLTNPIHTVAFSPDGRWIVTGSNARLVQKWNAASGELVQTLATHSNRVTSVAFSADGRLLASASSEIQVRDFETGRLIHVLPRTRGQLLVQWIAFNSDATKLAAYASYTLGTGSDQINIFDLATRASEVLPHGTRVWSVAFSLDGKRLVSGGAGKPARIWDVATGEMLRALPVNDGRFVAFTPDGMRVLGGGLNGEAGLWDVADGSPVRSFKASDAYLHSGAVSPDGRRVATAGQDKVLRLWDTATGRLLNECRGHAPNSYSIYSVAFSPDGSRLASGGGDKTLRIWDADSGRPVLTLTPDSQLTALQFSPDGKVLAGGGGDQDVRLWEVATGRPLLTLAGEHRATVWAVAFSPDGKRIATGDELGALAIWNPANGRRLLTIDSEQKGIWGLAWSPDGNTIASAGEDGTIRLWETQAPGQQGTAVRKP